MFIKPGFESSSLEFQRLDVPPAPTSDTHSHSRGGFIPSTIQKVHWHLIAYNACSLHTTRITHLSDMWREGLAFFSAAEDTILGKSHYDK